MERLVQGVFESQGLKLGGYFPVAAQAHIGVDTGIQSLEAHFAQLLDPSLPFIEPGHSLGRFSTPQ